MSNLILIPKYSFSSKEWMQNEGGVGGWAGNTLPDCLEHLFGISGWLRMPA